MGDEARGPGVIARGGLCDEASESYECSCEGLRLRGGAERDGIRWE